MLKYIYPLLLFACSCESYNILVVFPLPVKSHHILGNGFIRILLEAGHNVTYITPFPIKEHHNLRQVVVSSTADVFPNNKLNIEAIITKQFDFNDVRVVNEVMLIAPKVLFEDNEFKKFMKEPYVTFDLVIAERMFNDIYSGFSALFDCPYIWSFSFEVEFNGLSLIDEYPNPAYTPGVQSQAVLPFTFAQRVNELWTQVTETYDKYFHRINREKQIYEKFNAYAALKGKSLPPYNVIRYNASIIFENAHPSMGQANRLPRNVASIGGYHIDPKLSPLPQDLKEFIENSTDGFIYFSMGSALKSKDIPAKLKSDLIKMFGTLKQNVVWKYEEDLPNLPSNIKIMHWAPQTSILAHPKCLLFITHGGLLSTTEAIHFQVPLIGLPVYVDQFKNIGKAVQRGFAKRIDFGIDITDNLKEAIEDMVKDPKYKETAKRLAYIYHHRLAPPNKELLYWVEHVIETSGATHLRSPALMMPWYQKMYLDLIALIFVILIITILFMIRLPSLFSYNIRVRNKKHD